MHRIRGVCHGTAQFVFAEPMHGCRAEPCASPALKTNGCICAETGKLCACTAKGLRSPEAWRGGRSLRAQPLCRHGRGPGACMAACAAASAARTRTGAVPDGASSRAGMQGRAELRDAGARPGAAQRRGPPRVHQCRGCGRFGGMPKACQIMKTFIPEGLMPLADVRQYGSCMPMRCGTTPYHDTCGM